MDVLLLTPRWAPFCANYLNWPGGPRVDCMIGVRAQQPGGKLFRFTFSFKAVEGDPIGDPKKPDAWGLRRLDTATWLVSPSIIVDGLHAFLVLTGVSNPPPWQVP